MKKSVTIVILAVIAIVFIGSLYYLYQKNQEDPVVYTTETPSKQTIVNKARKSRYKNALKKMNALIESKNKSGALKFLPKLNSELMKIAKSGIVKRQNASRNVSRITKKITSL